jgi:hypothetical protein
VFPLDPEAFTRLRDGDDSNIVFNRDRKGNYLILPRGGYCYLVPNKLRKITSQIYLTTKAIYDCGGYNESYREFHLVKPALVVEELANCWRLSRRGILHFITQYSFLDLYKQSPEVFKSHHNPVVVSESAESLRKRWSGDQSEIFLEVDRLGKYWLFSEGDTTYLIPNPNLNMNNVVNMRTVGSFFECINYSPNYRSFSTVKPAIVSLHMSTKERQWKLEIKGSLEFS